MSLTRSVISSISRFDRARSADRVSRLSGQLFVSLTRSCIPSIPPVAHSLDRSVISARLVWLSCTPSIPPVTCSVARSCHWFLVIRMYVSFTRSFVHSIDPARRFLGRSIGRVARLIVRVYRSSAVTIHRFYPSLGHVRGSSDRSSVSLAHSLHRSLARSVSRVRGSSGVVIRV